MSNARNREIMAKNIRRQMEAAGVKPKDVCDALQIPMPTFSDWIHGKTYPRIDKIERMAEYFGVSKAALVEETVPKASPEAIMAAFWGDEKDLTAEEIEQMWADVQRYVEFTTQQRKRNK